MSALHVGVIGAGAIGVHVALRLAHAGAEVTVLSRARGKAEAEAGILHAASLDGERVPQTPDRLRFVSDPQALAATELILLCVKSKDTRSACEPLVALPDAARRPVVSFQNGLRNPDTIAALELPAVAGMVSFNVNRVDDGGRAVYHQATSGPLMSATGSSAHERALLARLAALSEAAGMPFERRADMRSVQTGKLLLNLNNAICALSGVSIATSVRTRDLRRCFAASMREGLRIYAAAGERPATIGKLPPRLIARLLPLPDAVVLRVAKSLITIDPRARSSTLQDLEAGKRTEIESLNGELVRLAAAAGAPCPINRWIVDEVHRLEAMDAPAFHDPAALWAAIQPLTR